MRKAFLVVVVLLLPGLLLAQETQPASPAAQVPSAPKLGHPLDPADVAILTGKISAPARSPYGIYATPYPYYSYPANVPLFSQSVFAPVSTATQPPLAPLFFGRFGDRPFVVIGTGTPVAAHALFLVRSSRGRTGVVAAPFGGFGFGWR